MIDIKAIASDVEKVLGGDRGGHDMAHVERVVRNAMTIAKCEGADTVIVELAAYLHDVDDYKLVGHEQARALTNARMILERHGVDDVAAAHVLEIIPMMGYNNYLEGRRPSSLEGMVVSDADMQDALGAQGLIRIFEYNASHNRPFFIPTIPPEKANLTAGEYRAQGNEHAVQHFFDKLLKLPNIMMTNAGKREAEKRVRIMNDFLEQLFEDAGAEEWLRYLNEFRSS